MVRGEYKMNQTEIGTFISSCRKEKRIPLLYSSTLFIAILVCLICNLAIDGIVSWSLIPASAIIFTWAIFFPVLYLKKRGIIISFISLSMFTLPFLFLISHFTETKEVFTIGTATAVPSIVFLWVVTAIFHFLGKKRISTAAGISFLLSIPFLFTINIILSNMIAEPLLDIWDIFSALLLLTAAGISFLLQKKNS
jgi:hypothetical protein